MNNHIENSHFSVKILILMISISMFLYQIILTRIASVLFSYHYVFLITSVAILGLSIGSAYSYYINKEGVLSKINDLIWILSSMYSAVFLFIFFGPISNSPLFYILIVIIPFFIIGYIFGLIYLKYPFESHKLYLADLVGAGIGAGIVFLLIDTVGILRTIIIICLLPVSFFVSGCLKLCTSYVVRSYSIILTVGLLVLLFLPNSILSGIELNYQGAYKSDISTFSKVKEGGLTPQIVYSKWNSFSRTDVISVDEVDERMFITIDGGAIAPMYKYDGNTENLSIFKRDTAYLPFSFGAKENVLLIGAGGGRDVLYALASESDNIIALDVNKSTIEAVQAYSSYNGGIYAMDKVKVVADDGRGYLENSTENYDVIFLSLVMTNSSQGVSYAMAEDYIYTVEAFESYLGHLTENGKVGFLVHDLSDLTKVIGMSMKALQNEGVSLEDTPDYITVVVKKEDMGNDQIHYTEPVIIVKKTPFSDSELSTLYKEVQLNDLDIFQMPRVFEQSPIESIRNKTVDINGYYAMYSKEMTLATDNKPYFYNYTSKIPKILIVLISIVVFVYFALFGRFFKSRENRRPLYYFSILGFAFMLIEITTIQKFSLFLGHPSLSIVVILSSLLVGCGIGSQIINKSINANSKSIKTNLAVIGIVLINILMLLVYELVLKNNLSMMTGMKIGITIFIVFFQGFLMGIPFSRGLLLLSYEGRQGIIPMMLGVNGIMSVLGSVIAIILSMNIGFNYTLIFGLLLYALLLPLNMNTK